MACAADVLRSIPFRELDFLDVRDNGWADPSIITSLPSAPLALDMADYDLDDAGLAALGRWPGFARCRVLNLYNNRVTAVGIRALVLERPDHVPVLELIGEVAVRLGDHGRVVHVGAVVDEDRE